MGEGNSNKNQEIKRKFVEIEVIYCVSSWVGDSLVKDLIKYEDIENTSYYYADLSDNYFEGSYEEKEALIEELEEKIMELDDEPTLNSDEKIERLQNDVLILTEAELENREVFEWWLVTEWLFEKLRDKEEVVIDSNYGHIWGRCTTGQAILLDYIITEICNDLEILEGQRYEWYKKGE